MRFLANLAAVLIRPRETMRRILAEGPSRGSVLLLFALATVSAVLGDSDTPTLERMVDHPRGLQVGLLIAGVTLAVIVCAIALAWLYAWVPYFIGRFLGGTGEVRGVRAALAWGLAPAIWALLYRAPAAIWLGGAFQGNLRLDDRSVSFNPGQLASGCGVALVFVLLELAVLVWCAVAMSHTLGEAHRYSAWHALGTLALAAIAPLVVTLAAALAMM